MFHLIPDDDDDGGDGLSSASSSAASSSFSSAGRFSDVDCRDRPWQSEVEEIPSFRWLAYSPSPVRKPPRPEPSSEVDWAHLVSAQGKPRARQFTENSWVVLVEDDAAFENRCALVLAPGLEIRWQDKEISCWRYHAGAAVLRRACSLDIRAKVDAADLFPQTACVCVLVFQLLPTAFGLGETQEAWVSVGGRLASRRTVRLQQPGELGSDDAAAPRRRGDGWLEIELGGFSAGTYAGEGEAMVEMGLVTATGWVTDHSGAFLQTPCVRALTGSVVIDVGDDGNGPAQRRESTSPSTPRPQPPKKWRRRLHHMSSMGDECIEGRAGKDEQFAGVQPVRRSFSMDSSCDRQLYLAVQEILQQNPHFCYSREIPVGEGSSSSSGGAGGAGGHPPARVRRYFFSFGRSSRSSAVLPVAVDP